MQSIFNKLVLKFNTEIKKYKRYQFIQPAVVFDIDGTLLVDGIYAPNSEEEIIMEVYNFLLYLQNMDITIFIITARPDSPKNRLLTSKMLDELNIHYEYLYMWDLNIFETATIFKTISRQDIEIQGHKIIMSLGDNEWDYGDYGGLGVHIYDDGQDIEFIP